MDRVDLVNKRFGQLSVIKWVKRDRYGNQWWSCLCDCGDAARDELAGGGEDADD